MAIKLLDYSNEGYDSDGKAKIRGVFYADASTDLANYQTAERFDPINQVVVSGSIARTSVGKVYTLNSNLEWVERSV